MSSWKECKLGDVATRMTSGGTPSTSKSEYYDGNIPWLNTKEIKNCRIFDTEKTITDFKKNIKGVFDIIEYGEVEKNE